MRTLIGIFFLCFCSLTVLADHELPAYLEWNTGKIVLHSGESIEGKVSYDYKHKVVQCRDHAGKIKAFSAVKVDYFTFFDNNTSMYRYFASVDFSQNHQYTRKTFFEIVIDGKMSVLRQGKYMKIAQTTGFYGITNISPHTVIQYTYYIFKEGSFTKVDSFKKQVLPMMKTKEDELAAFISQRNIDVNVLSSQLLLVNYYNEMVTPNYAGPGKLKKMLSMRR